MIAKHERGCSCRSCIGRRNRRSGLEKQRKVARALGVAPKYRGQLGNEETWGLPGWQVETKSGQQVPKKLVDAFDQAQAARAIGDGRRVLTVWVPAGSSTPIAVLALDDFTQALSEAGPDRAYHVREKARAVERLAREIGELAR